MGAASTTGSPSADTIPFVLRNAIEYSCRVFFENEGNVLGLWYWQKSIFIDCIYDAVLVSRSWQLEPLQKDAFEVKAETVRLPSVVSCMKRSNPGDEVEIERVFARLHFEVELCP